MSNHGFRSIGLPMIYLRLGHIQVIYIYAIDIDSTYIYIYAFADIDNCDVGKTIINQPWLGMANVPTIYIVILTLIGHYPKIWKRNSYRYGYLYHIIPIGFPWIFHGFSMDFPWLSHGARREVPTLHPHRAPPGRGGPALPCSSTAGGGPAVLESAAQGTDGYLFILCRCEYIHIYIYIYMCVCVMCVWVCLYMFLYLFMCICV